MIKTPQESADGLFNAVLNRLQTTPDEKGLEEPAKDICSLICGKMKDDNDFYYEKFGGAKYKEGYWDEVNKLIQEK